MHDRILPKSTDVCRSKSKYQNTSLQEPKFVLKDAVCPHQPAALMDVCKICIVEDLIKGYIFAALLYSFNTLPFLEHAIQPPSNIRTNPV